MDGFWCRGNWRRKRVGTDSDTGGEGKTMTCDKCKKHWRRGPLPKPGEPERGACFRLYHPPDSLLCPETMADHLCHLEPQRDLFQQGKEPCD